MSRGRRRDRDPLRERSNLPGQAMALINYLTRIHFADRVLEDALAEQLRRLDIKRPLIVADGGDLADGPLGRTFDALPAGCQPHVFVVQTGSCPDNKSAGVREAFADGQCDGYIGLGGQAVLDLVRRTACQPRAGTRWLSSSSEASLARSGLIAIPTSTACVGLQPIPITEGHGCLTDAAMLPDVILCDPTLTLGQSETVTAAAGMHALSRCIEAYLGTTWNPPADGMALDGVRRASSSLHRAVHNGGDLDARREMMAAALDAGLAAQKGLGAVEALAHALEAELGGPTAHGSLHAALLPAVLAFNAPAIDRRLPGLRETLGLKHDAEVAASLSALGAGINLPTNLRSLDLSGARRASVAHRAADHSATRTNPRHATPADYVWMLEHAG